MKKSSARRCVITVAALPGTSRSDVRITGDVDLCAVDALHEAVDQLTERAPRGVFIDVGGVTFAGSELLNFMSQAHERLPRSSSLVLCGSSPLMIRMLAITELNSFVTVCDNTLG